MSQQMLCVDYAVLHAVAGAECLAAPMQRNALFDACTLHRALFFRNGEERPVSNPRIANFIETLKEVRFIFPPLKELLIEIFFLVFAVVEIVRFLKSLLS